MAVKKKVARKRAKSVESVNITIKETMKNNGRYEWLSYCVQGWRKNGKWQRKYFKDKDKAERFAADKRIELMNADRAKRSRMTTLNEEQLLMAENALDRLGETYNLDEVVTFFLDNHRPPEFSIQLQEAIEVYLSDQEDTLRPRTIIQKRSSLKLFKEHIGDIPVHHCSSEKVMSFLKALRGKDGTSKATRKTWNNYRNDINHFFLWAGCKDLTTSRPWLFHNPVESVRIFTAKQVAEQRAPIATTDTGVVKELFTHLMQECPELIKYYALAYFAGIRPAGEMKALYTHSEADGLINLSTRTITIPAKVSKTKEERRVHISENLSLWLQAYSDYPIIPKNFDRLNKAVRSKFKLQHDETRHSFISYHVAIFRSAGDAALQAGNSESIVKKHYLDHRTTDEGFEFFSYAPCLESDSVIQLEYKPTDTPHLRAI